MTRLDVPGASSKGEATNGEIVELFSGDAPSGKAEIAVFPAVTVALRPYRNGIEPISTPSLHLTETPPTSSAGSLRTPADQPPTDRTGRAHSARKGAP